MRWQARSREGGPAGGGGNGGQPPDFAVKHAKTRMAVPGFRIATSSRERHTKTGVAVPGFRASGGPSWHLRARLLAAGASRLGRHRKGRGGGGIPLAITAPDDKRGRASAAPGKLWQARAGGRGAKMAGNGGQPPDFAVKHAKTGMAVPGFRASG